MRKIHLLILLSIFIFESVHAQDNWMLTPSFPGGMKTSMSALQDSIFFVGTANAIYRTGNYGKSWKKNLRTTVIHSIYASPSGKIIAGAEGKMYISSDKGQTWDSVKLQTRFPVKQIAEDKSGGFYFITGLLDNEEGFIGDGVFYNAGDLKNWVNKKSGLFPTGYCEHINVDRFNRVYVTMGDEYVTGQSGLFISDDKGTSWSHVKFAVEQLGEIKTANTYSVNITPSDSVIVSVAGTATNFSITLNLIKHRNDLLKNTDWKWVAVRPSATWWMDLLLNPIHFAADGSWYSSVSGSVSQGGVFVSQPGGRSWSRYITGLGISPTLQFESFTFHEDSYGRIFSSQFLDERIYMTTRSMVDAITISGMVSDDQGAPLSAQIVNNFISVSSDINGIYRLKVPRGWTGTLTPKATQYSFDPASISISNVQQNLVDQNFKGTYTGTHWVWGFVKDSYGNVISDVEVTGFDVMLKTNEYGAFFTSVPHGWSGEITLNKEGWEITPATLKIDPVYRSIYAFEFVAKEKGKFIVRGTVKDTEGRAITDAQIEGYSEAIRINGEGEYVAMLPEGWSGELIVSHPDYVFTPDKLVLQNLSEDLSDRNFIGVSINSFGISGVIKDAKSSALAGVTLVGLPVEIKTNTSGNFEVELPSGWSGTITPVLKDYVFEPASYSITNLKEDRDNLVFSARYVGNYQLSGFIKLADGSPLINISLSGLSVAIKTDEKGYYSISMPAGWSGSITPLSSEYTFSPTSFTITDLDQNKEQINFSATIITGAEDDEFKLEVYPNPSNDGLVQIQFPEDYQSVTFVITSMTGQLIKQYEPGSFNVIEKIQLPAQGIFILAITYRGHSYLRKIVVQ